MKTRSLAVAFVVGAILASVAPAAAQTLPPITVPPLPVPVPVPVPPVTVPPLPVPTPTPPSTPAPTPPPAAGLPAAPTPGGGPSGLPVPVPGAGGGSGIPGAGSGLPSGPGSDSLPGLPAPGDGTPLTITGPGIDITGPSLPDDLGAITALQDALGTAVDTVTTVVCEVLHTVATNLTPVTGPVGDAVDQLPVSSVGHQVDDLVGFRADLQALSELPSRTLLSLSANLPGLLTVNLSLPACPEASPTTPGASTPPALGTELIPPSDTARTLRIVGSPVSVTRPAPALPSSPTLAG